MVVNIAVVAFLSQNLYPVLQLVYWHLLNLEVHFYKVPELLFLLRRAHYCSKSWLMDRESYLGSHFEIFTSCPKFSKTYFCLIKHLFFVLGDRVTRNNFVRNILKRHFLGSLSGISLSLIDFTSRKLFLVSLRIKVDKLSSLHLIKPINTDS